MTFGGAFAAGAAIFIAYNLLAPLGSFRDGNPGRRAWWRPQVWGEALQDRARLLFDLLNGASLDAQIGGGASSLHPLPFGAPLGAVFVIALLVAIGAALVPRRRTRAAQADHLAKLRRPLRWLLLAMGVFFVCCALTPAARGHHHVINLYPLPHILVGVVLAAAMGTLTCARRRPSIARAGPALLAGSILLLLVASDAALLGNTFRTLEATGGVGQGSDSIYALADDLRARPAGVPIHAMDWAIQWRVAVLLEGRIDGIDEPWRALTEPGTAARRGEMMQALLDDPRAEYVVALPGTAAFPAAWQTLQAHAIEQGRQAQVIETYYQRDGTPTMQRVRFVPAPR